jgi:hypothetical protein
MAMQQTVEMAGMEPPIAQAVQVLPMLVAVAAVRYHLLGQAGLAVRVAAAQGQQVLLRRQTELLT